MISGKPRCPRNSILAQSKTLMGQRAWLKTSKQEAVPKVLAVDESRLERQAQVDS